jgi:mannose/fructose-specific phosphotransferase system component IIA
MKTVYVVDGAKIANILSDPMRNLLDLKLKCNGIVILVDIVNGI